MNTASRHARLKINSGLGIHSLSHVQADNNCKQGGNVWKGEKGKRRKKMKSRIGLIPNNRKSPAANRGGEKGGNVGKGEKGKKLQCRS